MLESLQMFLFLFKSKYRRKYIIVWPAVCYIVVFLNNFCGEVQAKCQDNSSCGGNGVCKNDTCVCFDGWQGSQCQFCGGKVRLASASGTIHDGLGNYSVGVKCSWLVDAPNSSITLHLEEFATECGWDHLYVYDGDSVDSPLLAVFSGLMYKNGYRIRRIPEVTASSGSALLHFFSDDAYNMSGFNLTYRLNACPSMLSGVDCSGKGVCIDGVCTCDATWYGNACHLPRCPSNCSQELGRGRCVPEKHKCECKPGFCGVDCGQVSALGCWETVSPSSYYPPGSASHGAAVWRDSLYIVAGESYARGQMMYIYDFNGNIWETPHMEGSIAPSPRYAHSTVLYGDKLFLYGGVLGNRGPTSELWAFDISAKNWENVTVKPGQCRGTYCGPLKSAGHTATIVTNNVNNIKADKMVVIFGHSPNYGYLNTVQEFNFGTREWIIVNTTGFPVKGGYGHSAAWDPLTRKIYVYGGVVSENESTQILSNRLYSYDPDNRIWMLLANASSARFLHSATFISSGLMLVFGGNIHNDTSHSFGAKCYSSDLLAYDVTCDSWQQLSIPLEFQSDLARFGHSAVTFENQLYIYGGFDGQMLSDMLRFKPGNCSHFTTLTSCLNTLPGMKCIWDHRIGQCIPVTELSTIYYWASPEDIEGVISKCHEENRTTIAYNIIQHTVECLASTDCASCVQTTRKCVWCGGKMCTREKCREGTVGKAVISLDECPLDYAPMCRQLHTCSSCGSQPNCRWHFEQGCKEHVHNPNSTESQEPVTCSRVCSEFTSCLNCTQEECIWCQNEGRCVDKNAYTASFPYGQCREWTTVSSKCRSRGPQSSSQCSFYVTCAQCRDDPACGWCDDGSKRGLGQCLPGGYTGPTLHEHSLPSSTCPPERWHFTTCPACQCNGHATCLGNSSECKACENLTTGPHCERCISGYWGNPVNGGRCEQCECNGQATQCHPETGKCFCTTKGLTGDHCEKCDATNHYHGDPSNKGSCYYDLTIDYQFTFNLSKKEDHHYTQINFRNSPMKPDVDADFTITCSVPAKMNITIKKANSPEKPILIDHNCSTNFRSRFTKADYNFGVEDNVTLTTFYVYVYDFKPPIWIVISFSQYPKLNLQQFFITFSTCFLLLLLVAAILWKIKQRYDMYRRRQRLFVEMEQMASRPFSQVLVELECREKSETIPNGLAVVPESAAARRRKRDAPSPIALEPCAGNRAAVLSLLVRLPTGSEYYTPRGQSAGLAIASALVTLGNPRKPSVDQCKTTEGKSKSRKAQSQHPDSCL